MRCFICSEKIENEIPLKLFEKNICRLCMYSIAEVSVDNIFYDFYKERIKMIQQQKLKETI